MTEKESVSIPTNEDIVSEITNDLQTELNVTEPNSEEILNSHHNEGIPKDFDKEESDTDTTTKDPDDYIDEEQLKVLENDLSDEEKAERHQTALELKNKGNEQFKSGLHVESVCSYTEALRMCSLKFENDRSIFYANRAASKIALNRKESAIEDCTKAIELNDSYIRAYLRRAKLYEETEKLDESLADYKKVLELDKNNKDALQAQYRLPPLIAERNEKLKTEMLGKLKDLGNMILKPFGLSTENFQLNQDPNSGGYSVNFSQNK
ncbi:tetratricopeptide repeat protein 1 [Diabrotica virgifera virgifera]|uniref:Tetratricopeptide repeat protein 1 n=1 Tax=Diabrotica virgifera virgifera TaxID=50390 RepID=A0ABM5JY51_DIAVI|nr:tetratricopeptide repeat protein 1 [Diabrotica virgifera virgifera]